eukprot:SM000049S16722  [mRNA]  locus=s49:371238:372779:+ [translate_table: standard]
MAPGTAAAAAVAAAWLLALGAAARTETGPLPAAAVVAWDDYFRATWNPSSMERLREDRSVVALRLTKKAGCGFSSLQTYYYGTFSAKIRLPPGFTAGVVIAFYMGSKWDPLWTKQKVDLHDEIDMEFLGNTTSAGISLQTNWYAGGIGNHEERVNLWFDPAAGYHEYTVTYNAHHIVWFVDGIPIREVKKENTVGLYPTLPMYIIGSIWEASDWATQGGRVKANWDYAPYYATYKEFKVVGCREESWNVVPPCAAEGAASSVYKGDLTLRQEMLLQFVRRHWMYYDWEQDEWRSKHRVGRRSSVQAVSSKGVSGT